MRTKIIALFICLGGFLSSCQKDNNDNFYLKDFRSEFQDAVITNPPADLNYPLLNDLRNNAGIQKYQVNLIGGLKNTDQTIKIKVVAEETTAVEGEHYKLPNGLQVVIPANSAFADFLVEIPTLTNTSEVRLVVELESSTEVHASANYKRIGLPIRK